MPMIEGKWYIEYPDFYRRTPEDDVIIRNRQTKLYRSSRHLGPEKSAELLHNAAKDYMHILPWLMEKTNAGQSIMTRPIFWKE